MNKNLESYIKVYRKAIPEDVCKSTIEEIEANKQYFLEHGYDNERDSSIIKHDNELFVVYADKITKNTGNVSFYVHKAVEKYILEDLNFSWFKGWEGFTLPRYNIYVEGSEMRTHCDHIHNMFTGERRGIPKLTVVGNLNSNFSGGKFVMFDDTEYNFETGDIVVFPSLFLFPHKVTKVDSGTRYSFASWVW